MDFAPFSHVRACPDIPWFVHYVRVGEILIGCSAGEALVAEDGMHAG